MDVDVMTPIGGTTEVQSQQKFCLKHFLGVASYVCTGSILICSL